MIVRPSDDASYFHVRAVEEQVAAQRATCAAARLRHDEMAAMYRFREMMLTSSPPEWHRAWTLGPTAELELVALT